MCSCTRWGPGVPPLFRSFGPICLGLVLCVTLCCRRLPADVRRAPRYGGLLEMYKRKNPEPYCITHRSYRLPDGRTVGEVSMDGRLLLRLVMDAGGFRVDQRAEIIARRLSRLLEMKAALEPVKVENWDGQWVVTLGGSLVVTAATGYSLEYSKSRRELANRWADQLRTALHNALGPGGQVLRDDPPVEKLHVDMPPWDDRYRAIVKGDRALKAGNVANAVSWYRKAVEEDRSAVDARYKLALALERMGRIEQARDELIGCIELNPDYRPAREALDRLGRPMRGK